MNKKRPIYFHGNGAHNGVVQRMDTREKLLRDQICDMGRRMYLKNMVAANDGNISVRLAERCFVCTPTGISKGYMTPEMLCKINERGELVESNPQDLRPSSEIKMHLKVYEKREDVNAVVHAHPLYATAHAVCNIPLDRQIMPEATVAFGIVPIAEYGAPSTSELPDSLLPFLDDYDAVLLANHGAVTYGEDVLSAYHKMESLEFYAKLLYLAGNLGTPRELSSEKITQLLEIREKVYKVAGRHPGEKCLGK